MAEGHAHRLRAEVDLANFGDHHRDARQEAPQRGHAVAGIDAAAGDLGQQRLKDEEVVATDQHNVDVTVSKSPQVLGGEDATKSTTKNDDLTGGLIRHRLNI